MKVTIVPLQNVIPPEFIDVLRNNVTIKDDQTWWIQKFNKKVILFSNIIAFHDVEMNRYYVVKNRYGNKNCWYCSDLFAIQIQNEMNRSFSKSFHVYPADEYVIVNEHGDFLASDTEFTSDIKQAIRYQTKSGVIKDMHFLELESLNCRVEEI
ncbi:hypothetical protein VmeM32_00185 [Vibrio phage vB_VmeM-32]|nr:hypothetical protein VmeM32_00185 [Vibrio phage vB_VmeM-32]